MHPKKIAERLGHSSIKPTMDTCGHLFDGSDQESAERMERLFGNRVEAPKVAVDSNVIRIDRKGAGSGKRGRPATGRSLTKATWQAEGTQSTWEREAVS